MPGGGQRIINDCHAAHTCPAAREVRIGWTDVCTTRQQYVIITSDCVGLRKQVGSSARRAVEVKAMEAGEASLASQALARTAN